MREIHRIVARLVQCYLARTSYFEVGCKALFLELLYYIVRQFREAECLRSERIIQKARAAKLAPVLEFVQANHSEAITLKVAASLAKTSVPQFVRLFMRVAGMSFVTYLTHVRLSRAARLLKESSLTIAQVACEVGSLIRAISIGDSRRLLARHREIFGNSERSLSVPRKNPGVHFRKATMFKNQKSGANLFGSMETTDQPRWSQSQLHHVSPIVRPHYHVREFNRT